ncbi:MAG: hypothetical protein UU88_C0001G0033 [Parcubacteria group bacterium GW2011_GWC1_42_11]|uniref:Uncharacterized protein n=1 Tax=Candidatus Nomurabacteria bacterium GW2011_GWC2_42_20 TaxID=1618756 RepID=A0A0G0ZHD0_9BACT|nr:MAG: hypothetical protein UU88_C0001G0033 [Parcubacteria group bacterium GW2011_GWC1_42_11]KKS48097.1 MAG: hypothetical protein UV12_C0003G0056 [Candidatus Nomurabacteria bacterium GW2011_GWC2_42_20]KKT09637.1 MAG: hypothetical protein UV86_C0004G0056 [Candidatus Nomurabacteria bacterium GW2011_GWB1_43_20]TAN36451.1 MAG: hypothetical protein EPN27_01565 [Patescibacteria group bacterium]HBH71428.1 hypothetical protein [Candidatus Yonathbacteria bacterium]
MRKNSLHSLPLTSRGVSSFKFSQELIEETIQCFREENTEDISPETANEYLNSLSGFFLALADNPSPHPKDENGDV